MAFPKIKDIKDLTAEEINTRIINLKKDILDLHLKKATKQNVKSHIFKYKKHLLAQLLTIEQEKI